ncbi:helix-turn-helix domain-containing protein [Harryflintia acetispora]|uniref:helix-turn-helix domain-containing protein n=1 Tax=Harryflintia acetispora TaxID=1849041 RepID=UPI0018985BC8|nr:AraC family transcriptional regulator [Harryflintia acetispora]
MPIEQEQRHAYFDRDLRIEAYNLSGIVQKFPNYFHEFYVIGFVEGGKRHLWCKGKEYDLGAGDLILFSPRDNHFCAPLGGEVLDYRALNIQPEVMRAAAQEITGTAFTPVFTRNVVFQSELAQSVGEVYGAILSQAPRLQKEEAFYFLLEQVLRDYAAPLDESATPGPDQTVQALCAYMEQHFSENVTLDELLSMTSFGKSYLIRTFTRQVGVSPYRYLQTVRLERAKRFLEQGVAPIDAASMAGFSDQSHFTNFFKEFIGLTPKQYQRIFTDAPPGADGQAPQ